MQATLAVTDPTFRNRALTDFLCAVAAVHEGHAPTLGAPSGLDLRGLRMAVVMAFRHGFVGLGDGPPCTLTERGARWAASHYRHARALVAVKDRYAAASAAGRGERLRRNRIAPPVTDGQRKAGESVSPVCPRNEKGGADLAPPSAKPLILW